MSCVSATFCAAVGTGGLAALMASGSWTTGTIDGGADLVAVSCATTAFCVAVDGAGNALTYSGGLASAWTAAAVDPGQALASVSCPTATFCVAVDGGGGEVTMSGTNWGARVVLQASNALHSVSCVSATSCMAVATSGSFVFVSPTWTAKTTPLTFDPVVSCQSTTFCEAVDGDGRSSTWNGSAWSSVFFASGSSQPLISLSCPTATFCFALEDDSLLHRFAGGTSWTTSGPVDEYSSASAVSCPSATFCALVDTGGRASLFNGTSWTTPAQTGGYLFTSVSCVSSTFCVAVGIFASAIYNGTGWSSTNLGDNQQGDPRLTQVSCASTTFCFAADDAGRVSLFNGTAWTGLGGIDQGTAIVSLSCASSTRCAAVDGASRILTFDGTTWSNPSYVDASGGAFSVSCAGTTCTVGDRTGYVLTWSGGAWSAAVHVSDSPVYQLTCQTNRYCHALSGGSVIGFGPSLPSVADDAPGTEDQIGLSCGTGSACVVLNDLGQVTRAA